MNAFRSLDDAAVNGKRVLLRVDLNVPMQDGKVSDSTRIAEIVPTIAELAGKGGKVILLSHFGRPKGGPEAKYSLKPVAAEVARIVKRPVAFADDCIGPTLHRGAPVPPCRRCLFRCLQARGETFNVCPVNSEQP